MVWLSDFSANAVVRFDPQTEKVRQLEASTRQRQRAADPRPARRGVAARERHRAHRGHAHGLTCDRPTPAVRGQPNGRTPISRPVQPVAEHEPQRRPQRRRRSRSAPARRAHAQRPAARSRARSDAKAPHGPRQEAAEQQQAGQRAGVPADGRTPTPWCPAPSGGRPSALKRIARHVGRGDQHDAQQRQRRGQRPRPLGRLTTTPAAPWRAWPKPQMISTRPSRRAERIQRRARLARRAAR